MSLVFEDLLEDVSLLGGEVVGQRLELRVVLLDLEVVEGGLSETSGKCAVVDDVALEGPESLLVDSLESLVDLALHPELLGRVWLRIAGCILTLAEV